MKSLTPPRVAADPTVERPLATRSGYGMLGLAIVLLLGAIATFALALATERYLLVPIAVVALLATPVFLLGLVTVQPNQALAAVLFGRYLGTTREPGFHWLNPFAFPRIRVSLRVRNFVNERMKVNDATGNPIEIAAVVVWRVVDSARAVFDVDDYESFVAIQSETALRHLASLYPYDDHSGSGMSLRANADDVAASLKRELEDRLGPAGVEVVEARLAHLAYAPEIAEAMLRRQQASAVVAARREIVDGAVGMVESALDALATRGVVDLDHERRATMVSNLMVVLTADRSVTPVINTGTLS